MASFDEDVLVWRDDLEDQVICDEKELYAKFQIEPPDWWTRPSPYSAESIELKIGPLIITRANVKCNEETLGFSTDEYNALFLLASYPGVPVLDSRIKLEYYDTYLYPWGPSIHDVMDSIIRKLGDYGNMIRTYEVTSYSRAYQLKEK